MLLPPRSGLPLVWAKLALHWLSHGLPLLLTAPLLALMFGLNAADLGLLLLTLLLGTPLLSLLGARWPRRSPWACATPPCSTCCWYCPWRCRR